MRNRIFIVVCLILSVVYETQSRIIEVPFEFNTIQEAILNAQNLDTVLVSPGNYNENINFQGRNIVVGSMFLVTGNEDFIENTIIDAEGLGRSVVVFRNAEVAELTGFTIQNGNTDYGGGIYCRGANPTLSHLIVAFNTTERNGAGIYCTGISDPTISNVIIRNNTAGYCGGGFGSYGGSTPTLENVLIVDNYSDHVGGGIHCHSCQVELHNVTISRNVAAHNAGAIYLTWDARVTMDNSICWNNEPHEIYVMAGHQNLNIDISFSLIGGGRQRIIYWEDHELTWGMGNIDIDPQFVDWIEGNYGLAEDSPCIDAGNPESDSDPDGTIADMGAFYHHQEEGGAHMLSVPDRYRSIQAAIDDAENGDLVLVQPDVYIENIDYEGKEITVTSRLFVTGDTTFIDRTVIDGDRHGSVVTITDGVGENGVLNGFTIQNGTGTNWWDDDWERATGGGIFCHESSPKLTNLNIVQNGASLGGGIACLEGSNPIIRDCLFSDNSSVDGGALALYWNSNPIIDNCGILRNSATSKGGGIYCRQSNPIILDCIISRNTSEDQGGGIACNFRSEPVILRTAIVDNSSTERGGGVSCDVQSHPEMTNCSVSGNSAETGGGLYCSQGSIPALTSTIFWDNEPQEIYFNPDLAENGVSVFFSDIEGGEEGIAGNDNGEVEWLDGNISLDPLFVDPENGDYSLGDDSPCIDSGDPNGPPDPDGTRADMGAFYHPLVLEGPRLLHVPRDYVTIQTAISYAYDGDIVLVWPGRYEENIDFWGRDIIVGSLYYTLGDPAYIDSTVIDGGGNAAVVTFGGFEDDAALVGFTLENGNNLEGGGIFCINSDPTISHCVIQNNQAEEAGGGMFCYRSNPIVYNCTITRNTVEEDNGGGLSCERDSHPIVVNSILWENEPREIYFHAEDDRNSITVSYSDIAGGEQEIVTNDNVDVYWEEGNIDADPLFADEDNGNFHLTWGNYPEEDETKSPCIDAGSPDSLRDPDGTRADIGALYYAYARGNAIPLAGGWNMISSPIPPPAPDMETVWIDLSVRGNLYVVKDHFGRFYAPALGFNNMNDWDIRYGYQVRTLEVDTLFIIGQPSPVETVIPLREGWSIVSYLPEQQQGVRTAFDNIADALIFVKDGFGGFYTTVYDFSNMDPLRRGQGYKVKVSQASDLVWNVPEQVAAAMRRGDGSTGNPPPIHFSAINPTDENMSLLILPPDDQSMRLTTGSLREIGIFTLRGKCVGSAALSDNGPWGMSIWGDDCATEQVEGAVHDETLVVKGWDGSQEFDLQPDWIEGEGVYSTDGFAVIALKPHSMIPKEFSLSKPYPNPFNNQVRLSYALPTEGTVELVVNDVTGKEVAALARGHHDAGHYRIVWDGTGLPSGIYFAKLVAYEKSKIRKLMLIR